MSDWKPWNGGVIPVTCDEVFYRLRHSPDLELGPTPPELLRWDHGRTPESAADPTLRHCDIIAYRTTPRRSLEPRAAIADTHPKGGDAPEIAAPSLMSGGGAATQQSPETPNPIDTVSKAA